MNIGLFGGTFDPVHLGHLILAEIVRDECGLDELWFLPARVPPHKPSREISSAKARTAMLELAISGHAGFRLCDLELRREGPSFTIDTLRQLRKERSEHEFFLLMGADSLADLPNWKDPQEILQLARIIAVNRGETLPDLSCTLGHLGDVAEERIQLVSIPAVAISATDLRERQRQGKSIRYQVPRSVELYIQHQGLYRP